MKYPLQILGYHFNFICYCTLTECSRPSRYFIVSLANIYDNPSYSLTCRLFEILKNVQCLLSTQIAEKSYPYTIRLKLIIIVPTIFNVLKVYSHVIISVRAGLLVKKPEGMGCKEKRNSVFILLSKLAKEFYQRLWSRRVSLWNWKKDEGSFR